MAKAQTTSENPQGEVSQQDTPVLPMQYDVRIHSIQFDGPCRATASLNINGCFAVRGVKLMEGSNGLFVSMPGQINSKGEIKDICFPYTREARAELESAVVTAYQQALTQGMNRSPQSAPDPTLLRLLYLIINLEPLSPVRAGPHGTAGSEDGYVTH